MPLDPAKVTVSNETIAEWTAMQVANPKGKPTPEQAAALKAAKGVQAEFMKRVREQTGLARQRQWVAPEERRRLAH